MNNEQPTLTKYQESYIELIAKKIAKEVAREIEERLTGQISENKNKAQKLDERLQQVERKVFNGFGLRLDKIQWQVGILFGFYVIILGILVKKMFF